VLSYPGAAAHRVVRVKKAAGRKWRIVAISVTASIIFFLGIAYFVWDIYFRLPTVDAVSVKEKNFSLPVGPSIAVLPFENMSGDPEQDYFCDGLTENIITGLSSCPRLLVIARNSSFAYKGKPMKIPQIANELGVRYVVEGSVQKTGKRLRITAQLIDAKSGHHMWAEKYDRDLKDLFELQDELTLNIMAALNVRLTEGEQVRFRLRRSCNIEAIMKALKALEYLRRNNKDAIVLARQRIQEAITLCPEYSEFYTLLADTYIMELYFQSENPLISVAQASKALKKAMSIDENNSDAYLVLGYLYLMRRQHDEAIAAAEKAISLNPNGADAYSNLGYILYNSERYVESVEFINKAIRLNPLPPSYYFLWLGHSKRGLKRYGEAVEAYRKSAELEPSNIFSHLQLAITYELMGQRKAAKAAAAQVVRIDPTFSLKRYEEITPFTNRKVLKHYLDAAKKAGLSE
jgi:adenylate cyclase